jgi:hypothetical protein
MSEMLAATPNETLAKTFSLTESVVSAVPSKVVVIGGEGFNV